MNIKPSRMNKLKAYKYPPPTDSVEVVDYKVIMAAMRKRKGHDCENFT